MGTVGTGLQVRAKLGDDGTLGHVEVLDGGSQYSDENGPLILTVAPPLGTSHYRSRWQPNSSGCFASFSFQRLFF